jgi:hypothetical protein
MTEKQTNQVVKRTLVQTNLFDFLKEYIIANLNLIICAIYWVGCVGIGEFMIRNYSQVLLVLEGTNVTGKYINVLTICNYINIIGLGLSYLSNWYLNLKKISNGTEKSSNPILFLIMLVGMVIKGCLLVDIKLIVLYIY